MRNAFADELRMLAKENKDIMLLSGDIGNRLFDGFKEDNSDRFLNCGVAEQNMMGVAAGMALSGMRPVTYTITPFITSRCYEQIRVDVCYHDLPVIIVGVGGGLCYAIGGATHQSCEDIGMLRLLPNMTVVCPGDSHEVRGALRAALKSKGPVYIRLGKKNEPVVHKGPVDLVLGKSIVMKEGTDVCILSTGNVLPVCLDTAKDLGERGVSAKVVSFHTVKPLDRAMLADAFSSFDLVVTVEEHSLLGGFGAAVAEWLADQRPQRARLLRIGSPDSFFHRTCDQGAARENAGITCSCVLDRILELLG